MFKLIKTVLFPTYKEAKEYCEDNNIDYNEIEYDGDYATLEVDFNETNTDITNITTMRSFEIEYINSDDKVDYTIITDVCNKSEAIREIKKKLKKEIYRIVRVCELN